MGENTEKTEEGRIYVTKSFQVGKSPGAELVTDEKISCEKFLTEPAVISLEYGLTLNMGNYESCRLTVGIRLPCYKEQVEEAYGAATVWIEKKIQEQVAEIRDSKKLF
jgi:hypothetical protein